MNISSIIVIPHPERIAMVREALQRFAGVELHAVSPAGKMIVTLEADDDRQTAILYEQISLLDGVMSASMVYHQTESEPDTVISGEA